MRAAPGMAMLWEAPRAGKASGLPALSGAARALKLFPVRVRRTQYGSVNVTDPGFTLFVSTAVRKMERPPLADVRPAKALREPLASDSRIITPPRELEP